MKKIFGTTLTSLGILALPLTALAVSGATGINTTAITPYTSGIVNFINQVLVPILMAVAFIVFLWGVFRYFIYGAENESEKATGRWFAFWGIIGFVIILSLWGIINLLMGGLGLSAGTAPCYPAIGGSPNCNNGSSNSGQTYCQQAGGVYDPATGACNGAP